MLWIIIVSVVLFVVAIVVGVVVFCLIRRKRLRAKQNLKEQKAVQGSGAAGSKDKAAQPEVGKEEATQKTEDPTEDKGNSNSRKLNKTQESGEGKKDDAESSPKKKQKTEEYWNEDSRKLLEGKGGKKEVGCLDEAEFGFSMDEEPRAGGIKMFPETDKSTTPFEETGEMKAQREETAVYRRKCDMTQESVAEATDGTPKSPDRAAGEGQKASKEKIDEDPKEKEEEKKKVEQQSD